MESTYEKIKKLVAGSEVSLLNEQIWQQYKTIAFLEERVAAFERLVQGYTKVTMDLANEVKFKIELAREKTPKGRLGRSAAEVKKRWSEWGELDKQGWSPARIASRYGVDKATVRYAKVHNFVQGSCVPASLVGHEIVSLPPTRKGPRKNKTHLRLAA
jgi:hypothetical protein